ncbi:MAG TPA: TadE family protein [Candidatus Dormibacteraeota bacterium]|nr:TadE family protein [Candidatus Dormibacteraeota bacterium]
MRSPGQALVELAVSLPVMLILAFGAAQFVRVAITRSGLDAATAAAAAAAARAPSSSSATTAANSAFSAVTTGDGLDSPGLALRLGGFQRGAIVTATGRATVSLGFSGSPALRGTLRLQSTASARVEDWRSRALTP